MLKTLVNLRPRRPILKIAAVSVLENANQIPATVHRYRPSIGNKKHRDLPTIQINDWKSPLDTLSNAMLVAAAMTGVLTRYFPLLLACAFNATDIDAS